MGGKIAPSGEGRATAQWGGPQTQVDNSPAFTGQAESANLTPESAAEGRTWAPTEVHPSLAQTQQSERIPTDPATPPTVAYAAPVTVRELPQTALAEPIVTEPERRGTKWGSGSAASLCSRLSA